MKSLILKKIKKVVKHLILLLKIKLIVSRSVLKVVIGASGISQPGWIDTDIDHLNILRANDWGKYFDEGCINAILAEHVFEHLTLEEGMIAARNCLHHLKKNGYVRVAVPDGYFPNAMYIEQVKPMGSGPGCYDHKILYTYKTLGDLFHSCGFSVTLLEYFDEQGKFHSVPWNDEDGLIRRSRWHDARNNKEINYTSIILDAIKP
jgi:predicted SAM-dependent methyltransferase